MRKVQMVMFMTIDGQAQFPVYDTVPYTLDTDEPMWKPRFDSIDTIILGGVAYPKWAAYWPTKKDEPKATEWQKEFSRFSNRAEKVVFSKSLQKSLWENTRIVRGAPSEEVAKLKAAKGKNIAVGGGPRIAQSLLAEDLVDEILVQVQPSLIGMGKPLFRTADDPTYPEDLIPKGAPGRHDFVLLEAKALPDSTVFLHYALGK